MLVSAILFSLAPSPTQNLRAANLLSSLDPERVATSAADMDGDGDLDLVHASVTPPRVTWMENRGLGQFSSHWLIWTGGFGPDLRSLTLADLDGNGYPDPITTSVGQFGVGDTIRWLPNHGDGTFGTVQVLTTVGATVAACAEDVDGDGDVDLVYSDIDDTISWMMNLGAGVFAPPVPLTTSAESSSAIRSADLDGDGLLEIIWTSTPSQSMRVVRNLGNGQFAAPVDVGDPLLAPLSFVVGDDDQDGDNDLFVSAVGGIFRVENLGGLQFASAVRLAPGVSGSRGVHIGDLDRDGDLDLAVGGGVTNALAWMENLGGGSFASPVGFLGPSHTSFSVLVGDFDGDGYADPMAASERVEWWQNRGGGAFSPVREVNHNYTARPFDLNGDGFPDLLGSSGSDITLAGNLGDGTFGRPVSLIDNVGIGASVVAMDIGADGDTDLVVASRTGGNLFLRQVVRDPQGFTAPEVLFQVAAPGEVYLELQDMEGDGDLDVLMNYGPAGEFHQGSIVWFRNDGVGGLVFQSSQVILGSGFGTWGDMDGDGDVDFLDVSSFQVTWRRNAGDGTMGDPIFISGLPLGSIGHAALLADLDGDLDLDAYFFTGSNPSISWCQNLGGGNFETRRFLRNVPGLGTHLTAADFDLDGELDILAWGYWGSDGRWLKGLGDGTLGAPSALNGSGFSQTNVSYMVDLDGDLDLDVVRGMGSVQAVQRNDLNVGAGYCLDAVPNSTGQAGRITARGSASVAVNNLALLVDRLPGASFGYFLVADQSGFVVSPGGSQGALCLSGTIGRLNRGSAEIFQASGAGEASVPLDLGDLPTPTGSTAAEPGQTLYFQAWYRDANPTVTSNFTSALRVMLR